MSEPLERMDEEELDEILAGLVAGRNVYGTPRISNALNDAYARVDELEAENARLREALEGLLREEPNVYEGRLEASLYVSVDALDAALEAIGRQRTQP